MNGSAVFGEDESSPDRVTRWKTQLPTVRDPDDSSIDMEEGVVIKDYANDKYGAPERETAASKDSRVPLFVGLAIVLLMGGFIFLACVISALHSVSEGCVGVYFKHGALLEDVTGPGIHWSQPFVTKLVEIKVRPETKYLDPLVCTTRDGVKNVFRDVQVITSIREEQVIPLVRQFGENPKEILVYERVDEAIQLFCSNHSIDEVYNTKFLEIGSYVNTSLKTSLARFSSTRGVNQTPPVDVWNVFLPKPDVPPAIAANYRDVKVEWTKQLVAQQRQLTETIKKETEKIKAVMDAEREKEVDLIDIQKSIQREEGKMNMSSIANAIYSEKLRSDADALSYAQEQEAATNRLLLTPNYVRMNVAKALTNNTKVFFSGSDSVVGAVLQRVFNGDN